MSRRPIPRPQQAVMIARLLACLRIPHKAHQGKAIVRRIKELS